MYDACVVCLCMLNICTIIHEVYARNALLLMEFRLTGPLAVPVGEAKGVEAWKAGQTLWSGAQPGLRVSKAWLAPRVSSPYLEGGWGEKEKASPEGIAALLEVMQQLLDRGAELGLDRRSIDEALRLGRPLSQVSWVASADLGKVAQATARETMEDGRYVEYECYDASWASQGRAAILLQKWEDESRCLFLGIHGASSDGYYEHYVKEKGEGNFLFHVCDCEARRCKVRKARNDHRELIHIDKWRMLTPETMVGTGYLVERGVEEGMRALVDKARSDKATPAAHGPSGLDALLEADAKKKAELALKEAEDGGKKKRKSKSPEVSHVRDRSRSRRGRKESMDDFLVKKVAATRKARESEESKKKKKKKKKSRRRDRSKSSKSEESSSSEESSFRLSPARARTELWRLAQKKPGQLTQLALDEMIRYLADRQEAGEADLSNPRWKGQRVLAYLNQIMFVTHPPVKMGLRTSRELQTLAIALDHLLSGQLPQATDILIQRLKALEASLQEGGWHTAKHLEIIPPQNASLTREDEREMATKSELKMIKLRAAVARASKTK